MYNQSYEEYIRSILGYPSDKAANDIYQDYNMCGIENYNNSEIYEMKNYNNSALYEIKDYNNSELQECYPEIYKIVYPMVQKACQNISTPVTKETIDELTNDIYMNIEGNNDIYLNINLNNNTDNVSTVNKNNTNVNNRLMSQTQNTNTFNRNNSSINNLNINSKETMKNEKQIQVKETRQFNSGLNDIIRILLLRELLGRPNFPNNRPPFPPPGRPPFGPQNRPPFPPQNRPPFESPNRPPFGQQNRP